MTWELLRFYWGKYLLLRFHRADICADFCWSLRVAGLLVIL